MALLILNQASIRDDPRVGQRNRGIGGTGDTGAAQPLLNTRPHLEANSLKKTQREIHRKISPPS